MALLTKIGGTGWAVGATALALILSSATAQAEIIDQTVVYNDEDASFTIVLDGNVGGETLDGLTAEVEITFLQAYDVTDDSDPMAIVDYNVWVFNAEVINTTGTDPNATNLFTDARVSAFGFNTGGFCSNWFDPGAEGAGPDYVNDISDDFCDENKDGTDDLLQGLGDDLVGVGSLNGEFDTRVIGGLDDCIYNPNPSDCTNIYNPVIDTMWAVDNVFDYDNSGSFPNQFGELDVCFIMNTNNCQGGGSGGVMMGMDGEPNSLSFTFVLVFLGTLEENPFIELSGFGVRYQSLAWCEKDEFGVVTTTCFSDESGTGTHRAPEPGSLAIMALGLVGIGWSRRGRRRRKIAA